MRPQQYGYYASVGAAPLAAPSVVSITPDGRPQPWAALLVPPTLNEETLAVLCETLTLLDAIWLRDHPETPNLYDAGVRYELLPEYWMSVPWALAWAARGRGLDCKVLAAWRAAELRVRGGEKSARCVYSKHLAPGKVVYHVRVRRADGSIEDPSARLGMQSVIPPSFAGGPGSRGARPWDLLQLP